MSTGDILTQLRDRAMLMKHRADIEIDYANDQTSNSHLAHMDAVALSAEEFVEWIDELTKDNMDVPHEVLE